MGPLPVRILATSAAVLALAGLTQPMYKVVAMSPSRGNPETVLSHLHALWPVLVSAGIIAALAAVTWLRKAGVPWDLAAGVAAAAIVFVLAQQRLVSHGIWDGYDMTTGRMTGGTLTARFQLGAGLEFAAVMFVVAAIVVRAVGAKTLR